MKQIYKEQLFDKGFLVSENGLDTGHAPEVVFSLASLFNIRIVSGSELAQREMIPFVSEMTGMDVPAPFYRGFPETVRNLSSDQLLFDQVFHYAKTYGLNRFDEAGHSIFETFLERTAFKEKTGIQELSVITEEEALKKTEDTVTNLLYSSRPLNDRQYALVLAYLNDYDCEIKNCGSKNTAVRLLSDTRSLQFVRFLTMSDVIKLADEINYRRYDNEDIRKLNLRNQDRKLITAVINRLFEEGRCDIETCCEKKAVWSGLLHHIHYKPVNEESSRFSAVMHGKQNLSVYSGFEKALAEKNIRKAVTILEKGKGTGAVLRNLSYLLSRCGSQEDVSFVLDHIDSRNVIVLTQLLIQFADHSEKKNKRDFVFTAHNKVKVHQETDEELKKRRSLIPQAYAGMVYERVENSLRKVLKGRVGKVYIDPDMKRIALPLQENTSQGGSGVLAKGSRIPIEKGKKIRAFTYWEKVDDIDLSVIGLDQNGFQTEFSWRTMYGEQSDAITYSGDQTSGYDGGSEFFDVDVKAFRRQYPGIQYLIFCNNVFSHINFDRCFCKAGFMVRDTEDSGEVFEPKTVQSSYLINCASTFAYLFGIDLEKSEFIWLNSVSHGDTTVAGTTSLDFLTRYFDVTSVINMYSFFAMAASELTDDPAEAEVIVSDKSGSQYENAEVIRSCDFDKVLKLMNS